MVSNDADYVELVRLGLTIALSGLAGVVIGAWLTQRRERVQRRHDFVAKQLRDFYSRLLGLRNEIRTRSELRVRVHEAADSTWRQLCAEARDRGGPDELQRLTDDRRSEFDNVTEYDNRQLEDYLLPMYRQMVTIFRENLWLAEADTRTHFGKLLDFVELWDRWLAKAVPSEVMEALGHGEESLHPFYQHLQDTHDELRAKLARGEP